MNHLRTLRIGSTGADVTVLQQRLTRAGFTVAITGHVDDATESAVRAYQKAKGLLDDGIAGKRTQDALAGTVDPRALTQEAVARVADELGCDVAAIKAVIEVESPHGGYLQDGRVVILFERHQFWRQLVAAGIDPASLNAPENILSEQRGGYIGGAGEYPRLELAKHYGAEQAMESCSWGRFQIMGYHAKELGYESATHMAKVFEASEAQHLFAFSAFVKLDDGLLKSLRARKWSAFARLYNGPAYADNLYDAKLARAYARHTAAVTE